MKCPYCHHTETKVTDSRSTDDNNIRRRRECIGCGRRFTTYEVIEELPIMVIKRDGKKELFDRGKLFNGLLRSCSKRGVTHDQLEMLVNETEKHIRMEVDHEIATERIGEIVMELLKDVDQVAYVRFASVYRQFNNVESFLEELRALTKSEGKKGKDKK